MNIFEIATREKYRWAYKGTLTVEDLWDLSATALDAIYKSLNAEKRQRTDEESLLGAPDKAMGELTNKIEIVKYIFAVKQADLEVGKQKAALAEKKRRIMELIASKEDAALGELSIEELKKMLVNVDG